MITIKIIPPTNIINRALNKYFTSLKEKPNTVTELTFNWALNGYPFIDEMNNIEACRTSVLPVLHSAKFPLTITDIAKKAKITIPEASAGLAILEKSGFVKHLEGKYYLITKQRRA